MLWIFNRQTNEVKKKWMLSLNVKMKQKEGSYELFITVDEMSGLHFQWLIAWDAYLTRLGIFFFHIWRRRESNLAISYFVHIVPAYTFMSQFWLTRTMSCKTRQLLVQLLNHKQKRQRYKDVMILIHRAQNRLFIKETSTPSNLTWKAH